MGWLRVELEAGQLLASLQLLREISGQLGHSWKLPWEQDNSQPAPEAEKQGKQIGPQF